jgi:nucleoid-associated protein YgaU
VPAGLTNGASVPGASTGSASPSTSTSAERTHVIASGDTFEALAQKYYGSATKWQLISKANPTVEPERLKIGQKIRIPAATATATATLDVPSGAAGSVGARSSESVTTTGGSFHVVAKGDTLSSISRKYFGSDKYWRQILSANKGTTEKNLKIGQKLVIPAREAVAGAENTGSSSGS